MKNRDKTLLAITTIAIIALISFVIFYRKEEIVVIEARWWESVTSVKYDVTTTELRTEYTETCSGFGEDRRCITEARLVPHTTTTTYTRCSDKMKGSELPVIYPDAPCAMWPGDYVRYSNSTYISWRLEEATEIKQSSFRLSLWDAVCPGNVVVISRNILNHVTRARLIKRHCKGGVTDFIFSSFWAGSACGAPASPQTQ